MNKLKFDVPQGSILGPLLKLLITQMIILYTQLMTEGLLQTFEGETFILQDNEMKSNEDKYHMFVVNTEDATVKLGMRFFLRVLLLTSSG